MKQFFRTKACGVGALAVLVATLTLGSTGCSSSSDDTVVTADDVATASAFVGTWALYEGSTIQGNPYWYVHFREDMTLSISNNADGSGVRVSGTYSETDGALVGPFTNPGVGSGRIEATITDGVITLNFVEYWHTPNKVLPFVGTKQ